MSKNDQKDGNEKATLSNEILDERVQHLGKSISQIRWFIQIVISVTGFFVIALVFYAAFNLLTERSRLDQLGKDLKDDVTRHMKSEAEKAEAIQKSMMGTIQTAIKAESDTKAELIKAMESEREKASLFEGSIVTRVNESMKDGRDKLASVEKNAKERLDDILGKAKGRPELELFAKMNQALEGQTIEGRLVPYPFGQGIVTIEFDYMLRNIGDKQTDRLLPKLYFCSPIKSHATFGTSDEPDFEDETTLDIKESGLVTIPPGVSAKLLASTNVGSFDPEKKLHRAMLKIYYGGEKPAKAIFNLKFTS